MKYMTVEISITTVHTEVLHGLRTSVLKRMKYLTCAIDIKSVTKYIS